MADVGERLPLINENGHGSRMYSEGTSEIHWEFAGKGTKQVIDNMAVDEEGFHRSIEEKKQHHLGQLLATAIAGSFILFTVPFSRVAPNFPIF
jgi:hypothetical protein